ncbi:MAG: S-methyl-5'-thioinosine phosphorylase [Gallionellaceae bacterium]|jgi:5'-methylthioadenosine phosphorylase|nr:S-methyl-5'-thioinosine phosphorylase [Gallionellaceae bacterium]
MLAIIGGTGLTQLENLKITHRQVIRTPYGEASGALTFGTINEHEVVFLARHGYGYTIPPHMVNYRANLWALHDQGVTRVVAVTSVGGIRPGLDPGVIAIPDQIIDSTYRRDFTYFDGADRKVENIDFTYPYCPRLRAAILTAAQRANMTCVDGGVYAAMQGPRLETAAEVNRLERDGADMLGMTGMPEAALAKELGLSYAAIAVVANHAAGRSDSCDGVCLDINLIKQMMGRVRNILECLVENDGD